MRTSTSSDPISLVHLERLSSSPIEYLHGNIRSMARVDEKSTSPKISTVILKCRGTVPSQSHRRWGCGIFASGMIQRKKRKKNPSSHVIGGFSAMWSTGDTAMDQWQNSKKYTGSEVTERHFLGMPTDWLWVREAIVLPFPSSRHENVSLGGTSDEDAVILEVRYQMWDSQWVILITPTPPPSRL